MTQRLVGIVAAWTALCIAVPSVLAQGSSPDAHPLPYSEGWENGELNGWAPPEGSYIPAEVDCEVGYASQCSLRVRSDSGWKRAEYDLRSTAIPESGWFEVRAKIMAMPHESPEYADLFGYYGVGYLTYLGDRESASVSLQDDGDTLLLRTFCGPELRIGYGRWYEVHIALTTTTALVEVKSGSSTLLSCVRQGSLAPYMPLADRIRDLHLSVQETGPIFHLDNVEASAHGLDVPTVNPGGAEDGFSAGGQVHLGSAATVRLGANVEVQQGRAFERADWVVEEAGVIAEEVEAAAGGNTLPLLRRLNAALHGPPLDATWLYGQEGIVDASSPAPIEGGAHPGCVGLELEGASDAPFLVCQSPVA